MVAIPIYLKKNRAARAVRRFAEYAITVGLALLSSYFIIHGRW
jgi:hypothetical protein